tara:strand:- start:229 stop:504 length:276 start_codon:yes stop_codon:yes gene_type:complete
MSVGVKAGASTALERHYIKMQEKKCPFFYWPDLSDFLLNGGNPSVEGFSPPPPSQDFFLMELMLKSPVRAVRGPPLFSFIIQHLIPKRIID